MLRLQRRPWRAGWLSIVLPMVVLIVPAILAAPLAAQPAMSGGGSSSIPAADSARDAELDAMTATIGSKLRCLVCRGQSVQESSAPLAREMQALIRKKLEEGETPEEIEDFFVASYGDFILLKPRARGLSALVYILPITVFVLALLMVALNLRAQKGRPALATASPGSAPDPATPPATDDLPKEDRDWLDAAIRDER